MNTDDATAADNSVQSDNAPWRPFVDGLRAFISGRVPKSDAEDVLQETLLRLHDAADSLRDADRAEAWVFSIARRTIADHYRQKERRPIDGTVDTADEVTDEPSPTLDNLAGYPGDHDVHEEVLSWLRPMAEQLSDMYSRPLIMADFEGHTQQEVADELGLSLSGAKSRVQRARVKLRERLQQCCELEFGPEGRAVAFRRRTACTGGSCSTAWYE